MQKIDNYRSWLSFLADSQF